MFTKEKYFTIKEKYGKTSSFAIWGKTVSDMSVFDDQNEPWKQINDKYIIVALNPAGEIPGIFENFHSQNKKHADERLMRGIQGTSLEGSFMTDLSMTKTPNSKEVFVGEKEADDLINLAKWFDNLKIVFILSSKCKELDNYLGSHGLRVVRLLHYSFNNGRAIKRYCEDNDIFGNDGNEKYINALKHQIKSALKAF